MNVDEVYVLYFQVSSQHLQFHDVPICVVWLCHVDYEPESNAQPE